MAPALLHSALLLALLLEPALVHAEGSAPVDASAPRSCAEEVAATVQGHYDAVRDFSADFEQTTHTPLFGAAGTFGGPQRGEVVFAKPGKMRWTYIEPEPSLVVSDGETLWIYSPTLKEASRVRVSEGMLTGAALQFLLGDGKLLESFEVSAEGCPRVAELAPAGTSKPAEKDQAAAETIELQLTPREPASYQRLGITARVASGEVVATRVLDHLGNETVIAFRQIQHNQDPPSDAFKFVPGPDIEVIKLDATP